MLAEAVSECQPVQELLRESSLRLTAPGYERVAKGIDEAIIACKCRIEHAAIQDLAWFLADRHEALPRAHVDMGLAAEDEQSAVVALPPETLWEETASAVLEVGGVGKPLRFETIAHPGSD